MTAPHSLSCLRNIERGCAYALCEQLLAEPRDMQLVEIYVDDLRRIRAEINARLGIDA